MTHRCKPLVASVAAIAWMAAAHADAQAAPPAAPSPSRPTSPPAPDAPPGPPDRPSARPPHAAASGPTAPGPRHEAAGPATTLTGRIAHWLPNPNGEVDGLLLDDGTQVAFPPHLSARMIAAFKLRDSVTVTGRRGLDGGVVHAATLRNTAGGASVSDDGPAAPPAPPPARDRAALTAMTATGRIVTLLHTGRGDVNGAVLDDGTVLRFPPPAGRQMAASLKTGSMLFASGYGTRGTQGNAFEATRMGTSASDAQAVLAGPHGPHDRAGHGPHDPAVGGPGAPGVGARGPDTRGPVPADSHADGAPPPDDAHRRQRDDTVANGPPPPPSARPDAASAPR